MGIAQVMARAVSVMAAPMLFAACDADHNSQTRQAGDYFITITTDPEKPQVGGDAQLTAHIVRDDEGVERCRAGFRQYMPAHQMTTDHAKYVLQDLGQGSYRGRGSEFTMGGDWEVELQFNCGDGTKTVVFPFNLQWM